jgi:hypothetical protein
MVRRIQKNPRDRVESADQWRSTPRPVDWVARVERVRKRDQTCTWVEHGERCGSTERLEVDHIGDPADHDLDNLRLLCHTHHALRTNAQRIAGLRVYNERRKLGARRPPERHPGLLDNT